MAVTIPNLWKADAISVDVLSPLAILRAQASSLSEMTRGLLVGEVVINKAKGRTQYLLDVVAPALDNYRHRLVTVAHDADMTYPIEFVGAYDGLGLEYEDDLPYTEMAYTEQEFLEKLEKVLSSRSVSAVLQSLISRSNDTLRKDSIKATMNGQ